MTTQIAAPGTEPSHAWQVLERFALPLLWAVAFAVAHTQGPLFYSNQHQYFLHGLAQGGVGDLQRDWLANTQDPTPVFSTGVAWTYRTLGEWPFQVAYFLLLMIYFLSIAALCKAIPGAPVRGIGWFTLLALLVVVHSAILRLALVRLAGVDYPWYFQSGVAGQYVLGPGLQPSAFGVLLIASLAAFVHGRPMLAAACAVVACIVHATYLLPAAWFTLAYMHVLWHDGRKQAALMLGAGTLVAVLPIVAFAVRTFAATSPEQFAEAQHIIADVRIPHHAQVSRWFDWTAAVQIAWIGLALYLLRRTRLFPLLAIPAGFGVALTLIQILTGSETLALLFPWRVSAILVPVATAVILTRLAIDAEPRLEPGVTLAICGVLLFGITVGGIMVMTRGLGYGMNQSELAILRYVRSQRQAGDVYLIPVTISVPARGALSTTFMSPPRAARGAALIPVDFQRFRLYAGAPIYVDFKSIPYKDVEVLEWYRRVRQVEKWYEQRTWGEEMSRELTRAGITHVLAAADRELSGPALEQVYADDSYRLYRVVKAK